MIITDKRKEKSMTQAQLAACVQVTQCMICNIEKGKRRPSVTLAMRIGAVLDFDWALLFADVADGQDGTAK